MTQYHYSITMIMRMTHEIRERSDKCVLYQEEHSGLHDLPGKLLEDALFQEDLEHEMSSSLLFNFHLLLIYFYECDGCLWPVGLIVREQNY